MRHPCRILLLFFTTVFSGWGAMPLLHSQESMVDLSPMQQSAVHFPSDVFLGTALGYTITRFDVLRDRTH